MENVQIAENSLELLEKQETSSLLLKGELACREALASLDGVIPMMTDEGLRAVACAYRALYESYADVFRMMLEKEGDGEEKKSPTQASSWLSSQVKLAFRSHATELSALLFDTCHTMIRDLYAHLHGTPHAEQESRRAVRRLIGTSEDFREELKDFL